MNYQIIDDPRAVLNRLSSLVGQKSVYSNGSTQFYRIGPYTVQLRASLIVDTEDQDESIIQALISDGLILPAGEDKVNRQLQPLSDRLIVSIPVANYSARTLTNLIYLMYCQGELLSKATGGYFNVDRKLVNLLRYHGRERGGSGLIMRDDVLHVMDEFFIMARTPGMDGLHIDAENITFDGFPLSQDAAYNASYEKLAKAIVEFADQLQKVQLGAWHGKVNRRSMYNFLMRCMVGDEYKEDRKRLLERLSNLSS